MTGESALCLLDACDRERDWPRLLCAGHAGRLLGALREVPKLVDELLGLGYVERDVRPGTRAVLVDGERVRVPAMADPVANLFVAGPTKSSWSESRIRSTRPERLPVNVDAVDLTSAVNHGARRLQVRGVLGLDDDQVGHLSAATTLHRWVLRWAARRREREPERRDVAALCGWLIDRLPWALEHDGLLANFAEEVGDLRRALDGLAGHAPPRPEKVSRPCPACGWWALCHDRAAELIRCGHCERALTDGEYRDHLEAVIKTNWTRADRGAPVGVPLWVRDDAAGKVVLGLFGGVPGGDGPVWRSWDGAVLVEVSYWATVAVPADPGPAKTLEEPS